MRTLVLPLLLLALLSAQAQQTVTVQVRSTAAQAEGANASPATQTRSGHAERRVVVWLTPQRDAEPHPETRPETRPETPPRTFTPRNFIMVQHDKMFTPSMLVVPVGSVISFPNKDPFFHNVFSLFNGQRFDLGLYQSGQSRNITFSRAGVSYIFCNIHPEMAAVIIALDTPYYALADKQGDISIARVPAGLYTLHVWSAAASPEELNSLTRTVTVTDGPTSLGTVTIRDSAGPLAEHLNKFGQQYDTHAVAPYP